MGLFDFIFGKKETNNDTMKSMREIKDYQKSFKVCDINTIKDDDYLGLAANAKHSAITEIKNQNYNKAFELCQRQKEYYLKHAEKNDWNKRDTDRLCNSVHEDFANIYRLENKHKEALINLIFAIASNENPTKAIIKKLGAYLNRVKLNKCNLEDIQKYIKIIYLNPIIENIEKKIDRCYEYTK